MSGRTQERTIADLVYVGLNRRVIALDRYTGDMVWQWKAPSGSGYVTILLDGDRLVAGVGGYIYCLDPLFGQLVWHNPMRGFGSGVTSLVSVNGTAADPAAAAVLAQQQRAAAAAAGAS